jgi:membrane dipeptidase
MRLVDLYCDWSRQYATETTQYEDALYPEVPGRVGRLDGYLLATSLAVLACERTPADWTTQADPWGVLDQMISRYEAEFAGRVVREGSDVSRWRSAPPDGMCSGTIGVAGFDFLIRAADDLERMPGLFDRGVRVFQPVSTGESMLGGSNVPGDDRALTDLGRAFLARLAALAPEDGGGPRPILDLAGLNARSTADVLRWLDDHRLPAEKLPMIVSRGPADYRPLPDDSSPDHRALRDLRERGAVIGLTPGRPGNATVEEFKQLIDSVAAIPFEGRPGYEGIAIGSDLLGLERTAQGLSSAREIARWLGRTFDRESATALCSGNASRVLVRSAGVD